MSTSLPIFFHIGEDLTLKTHAHKGRIVVGSSSIQLSNQTTEINLSAEQLKSVSLFRLHAIGSVIKVDLGSEYLYLAVTRFMIGQFAMGNYFATQQLFKRLSEISPGSSTSELPTRSKFNWKRSVKTFLIAALASFALIALLSFIGRNSY